MVATLFVQPLDVIKNRIQMSKKKVSIAQITRKIIQEGGVKQLYTGLSASLLRQSTYSTGRLGIYNSLLDAWKHKYK